MKISWYPGHMHKAKKELVRTLASVQVVMEVLDARAPAASSNPMLAALAGDHPRLYLINKSDLADPRITSQWQKFFAATPSRLCLVSGPDKQHIKGAVLKALQSLCPHDAGSVRAGRQCLILGIPNTGKSTLLNALVGRKAAKTGNEPAITQGQQRVRLNDQWSLVDSPGMLWPNLQDQQAALLLAVTGAIRQTALDIAELGWSAAELLLRQKQIPWLARYNLSTAPESAEHLMLSIATAIGAKGKSGKVDWHRTAEALLNDYRSGKLGRISLESPRLLNQSAEDTT